MHRSLDSADLHLAALSDNVTRSTIFKFIRFILVQIFEKLLWYMQE